METRRGQRTATRDDTRDARTGAMISAAFARGWAMWGASGLPSSAAAVVRIFAVLACVGLIGRAIMLRRTSARSTHNESMYFSSVYRRIVAVEVVALFGGGAVLSATGGTAYTIAWFALVVGAHFLWFGQRFWTGFSIIGVVLIGGALAGGVIGLTGGSEADIRAFTGLTAAIDLFLASASTLVGTNSR